MTDSYSTYLTQWRHTYSPFSHGFFFPSADGWTFFCSPHWLERQLLPIQLALLLGYLPFLFISLYTPYFGTLCMARHTIRGVVALLLGRRALQLHWICGGIPLCIGVVMKDMWLEIIMIGGGEHTMVCRWWNQSIWHAKSLDGLIAMV